MIEKIIRNLYAYGRAKCELTVLQKWIVSDGYSELVEIVAELEQRGIISPVKSSKLNGKNPPLYQAYHIIPPKTDDSTLLAELDAMHYRIRTDHLRRNPEKYKCIRHVLLPLSEYLKKNTEELDEPMSENERAYVIWGDEKFLEHSEHPEHIAALKKCGVWDLLHTYPTPEPFFDYRKATYPEHVLVIENKDTWFSMRKIMMESDASSFFQLPVDCLVYGEGNKITKTGSSLEQYLNIDRVFSGTVHYWGDLDPEGIGFFLSAREVNPGLNLQLYVPAYQEMLAQFEEHLALPHEKEQYRVRKHQKYPADADVFYARFPERMGLRIRELMETGYYIPQEILHYQILKHASRLECMV